MVQPVPNDPASPAPASFSPASPATVGDRNLIIPELDETADVTTRMVETGVVRITKHIHDVERSFQPTLHDHRIHVERIPINRVIKSAPDVRTEGDVTIIPVVEEVMVKLLLLKEEVRITREQVDKPSAPQAVTLRREEVTVERHPAGDAHAPAPADGSARPAAPQPSPAHAPHP